MFSFLAQLRHFSRGGRRRDRVSVLLPFLIISIGLGALAWRSYTLSVKMERGANMLAQQYAGYAADITAKRVDAAIRSELARASDEWQQTERRVGEPTFESLRDWITHYDWIVAAIYVPDYDPASSIYVSELAVEKNPDARAQREFFTSSGTVRYTYDPDRLLAAVHGAIRQQPLIRSADSIQPQAVLAVVQDAGENSKLIKLPGGFAYIAPLAPPMAPYGVRATVRTSYVGSGWENQRLISLWVSLLALVLMGVGAILTMRGMRKEAETMKLRGALIANVSHELRTPLSMIRLGAETLKRGTRLKEKERADIEDQILREVLLLSHLVENVLDVARIQNRSTRALAFTPVRPRDLVTNLVTTYESWIRSKGFVVSVNIDEAVGEQMWDRDAVSRALLNLIDNAIKYGREDDRSIDVTLRQNAEHVVLEVRDHGIGIEAKDVAKIFDPYFRAKFSDTISRRGAGLGLTLVQQIVESHGGRVEVESEPGVGSTFRLLFPRDLTGEPDELPSMARAREAF
ncbi:MAG TPA: HAMP domain-containing sensor histidine kinase [Thermoanaerobaculia bacterium]|nr:HAMP domain-containing sensor histidine kinase [Thermoanaerobaculia bacterium]